MTDLEISKALALAIGWKDVGISGCVNDATCVKCEDGFWRTFDYRDWSVIGPIAERYDCFPRNVGIRNWACCATFNSSVYADTPQKSIALAVIGAKK